VKRNSISGAKLINWACASLVFATVLCTVAVDHVKAGAAEVPEPWGQPARPATSRGQRKANLWLSSSVLVAKKAERRLSSLSCLRAVVTSSGVSLAVQDFHGF